MLSHQVADTVSEGLARMGVASGGGGDSRTIPDLSTLPAPIRALFERAFGEATDHIFLVAVPFAVLALGCVLLIREVPLRTTILREDGLPPEVAAGLDERRVRS